MTIAQITDHVARALGTLPSQWGESPRLRGLVAAMAASVQTLDDSVWAVATQRFLAVAVGAQLDLLGDVVGQPRGGLDDEDYRRLIGVRAQINRAGGRVVDMLAILALLFGLPVRYRHLQPAAYIVAAESAGPLSSALVLNISRILNEITPAGIRRDAVYGSTPMFRLGSNVAGLDAGLLGAVLP